MAPIPYDARKWSDGSLGSQYSEPTRYPPLLQRFMGPYVIGSGSSRSTEDIALAMYRLRAVVAVSSREASADSLSCRRGDCDEATTQHVRLRSPRARQPRGCDLLLRRARRARVAQRVSPS